MAASSAPNLTITSNSTSAPTSIVRVPSAISTQWNRCTAPVVGLDVAQPDVLVEVDDAPERHGQWTILAIGISSRSVAPASLRAGMMRLMLRFSTTLSTA